MILKCLATGILTLTSQFLAPWIDVQILTHFNNMKEIFEFLTIIYECLICYNKFFINYYEISWIWLYVVPYLYTGIYILWRTEIQYLCVISNINFSRKIKKNAFSTIYFGVSVIITSKSRCEMWSIFYNWNIYCIKHVSLCFIFMHAFQIYPIPSFFSTRNTEIP